MLQSWSTVQAWRKEKNRSRISSSQGVSDSFGLEARKCLELHKNCWLQNDTSERYTKSSKRQVRPGYMLIFPTTTEGLMSRYCFFSQPPTLSTVCIFVSFGRIIVLYWAYMHVGKLFNHSCVLYSTLKLWIWFGGTTLIVASQWLYYISFRFLEMMFFQRLFQLFLCLFQ